MTGTVKQVDYNTAVDFLLPRHYSGRVPQIVVHHLGKSVNDLSCGMFVNRLQQKSEDIGTKNSLW